MALLAKNDFDRVKDEAAGHWQAVIGRMYPDLAQVLQRPGDARCACPVHGTGKGAAGDGFRVFEDFPRSGGGVCNTCGTFPTGIDLVMFLEGCDKFAAVDLLKRQLGLDGRVGPGVVRRFAPPVPPPPDPAMERMKISQRREMLSRLWMQAKPLDQLADDHQAIAYLRDTRGIGSRAVIDLQKHMRFHSSLYYARSNVEDEPPIAFPAIVSMMHGAGGRAVGLHRIFLDLEKPRKAPVVKNKKILRCLQHRLNGAVRLIGQVAATAHVQVCEGIENGLAITCATGRPVFAAGYGTLVQAWTPPDFVRFVTIWADRDKSGAGLGYAVRLRDRLEGGGIQCRILMPGFLGTESEDWNDVLLQCGPDALREAYAETSTSTQLH